jgi:hypothetical protein
MFITRFRLTTVVAAVATAAGLGLIAPPAQATLPAWRTTTVTVDRNPAVPPQLVQVRFGMHPNFDRVVFDLRGAAPGYTVRYVKTVYTDARGDVVPMRGRYYLSIVLHPAYAHSSGGHAIYAVPYKFWVGYPQLRQFAFVGDYEGYVSAALGLRYHNGFRVFTLHNPTRIIVDVHH